MTSILPFPVGLRRFVAVLAAAAATAGLAAAVSFACQASTEETREGWQRVPEIVHALGVRDGSAVADIGAGGGFFTTRLAREVGPHGRVYAIEIAEREIRRLRERTAADGLTQVEVVQGERGDPRLPTASIDAALIVNAYHEMREHQAMLAGIRAALRPGGRLVIVEPIMESRRGQPREQQERSHEIGPEYVRADLEAAGFEVLELHDPFTTRPSGDTEWLIVVTPRQPASGP